MADDKPNRNPTLRPLLSQRLLDHIDCQLLGLGEIELTDRTDAPARGPQVQAALAAATTPKEPRPYGQGFSHGVACTVSVAFFKQVDAYAIHHNMARNAVLRAAVQHFLDNPVKRPVRITPYTKYLPRRSMLNVSLNPKTYPGLKDRLEDYADENNLAVASVLRRAAYEYTRNRDEEESEQLMLDAWADAELR